MKTQLIKILVLVDAANIPYKKWFSVRYKQRYKQINRIHINGQLYPTNIIIAQVLIVKQKSIKGEENQSLILINLKQKVTEQCFNNFCIFETFFQISIYLNIFDFNKYDNLCLPFCFISFKIKLSFGFTSPLTTLHVQLKSCMKVF